MKEYSARATSLALNVQYHSIEVSEQNTSRRVLNGLPLSYAPEKINFALKTDFSLAELAGGLVRVEKLNKSSTGLLDSNVSRVVTLLEPTPFPPLSSVLGEIQFVGKTPSRPECRIDAPLAAAALTPGPLKHGKEVDINHLHVSLSPAHASVLKATAKQHEIRLTGELVLCSACSRAKGHRALTPHHATKRGTQPLGFVHMALPSFSWGIAVRRDVHR